jgi:hypothetical protein
VKIISNDTIQLEELYKTLRRDGQEKMTLDKVPVENAMGFDVILNIDIDATKIIIELATTYLEYRLIKGVFLQKPSGEKEPIDTEVLEDPKALENLKIEKDTTLYIEYKER